MGVLGLALVVACFWAAGRALCRWAGEPRRAVAGAVALALAYALPVAVGRFVDSFYVASAIAAAIAAAIATALRGTGPRVSPPPLGRASWAASLAALVLVVWATIGTRLWDETNAHFGLVRVIARGMIPPAHPLYPAEPFRYHYGFDVLGALPQAFLGLRTDHAIDVATIVCWLALFAMARAAGAALAGARGASFAVLVVPLGSGLLQVFLFQDFYLLGPRTSAVPAAWGSSMPPPVISNFFQHPQGLGMSISLAVALLWCAPEGGTRRRLLGALLLGALSLGQIVFFGVCGLAAGVASLTRFAANRKLGALVGEGLLLLGALAIAYGLGGFLAPGAKPENVLVLGKRYFDAALGGTVARHLAIFGLPLVALPFALLRARSEPRALRAFVLTGALVGFVVPNVVGYERSWDIVKFFGIGGFFANVALAELLAARLPKRAFASLLAMIVTTLSAWVWLLRMSIFNGILGVHPMQFGPPSPIAVELTERLDPLVGPRERVLATNIELAMTGGFLTPGFRWQDFGESYLMDRREAERLSYHLERARHDLLPEDLAALDVRFVVLTGGELSSLGPEARRALDDPRRFEPLFVVELGGDSRHVYRVVR